MPSYITKQRIKLGRIVHIHTRGKVIRGPFEGVFMPHQLRWGRADLGGMLLGLYESEVVDAVVKEGSRKKWFVDVGAADGFFLLGALVSGVFDRAIAFESDQRSVAAIHRGLALNGVTKRATIFGNAGPDFVESLLSLSSFRVEESLILVDIEGGEYNLLTEHVLQKLSGATIIVELHEFTPEQSRLALDLARLAELMGFHTERIKQQGRNPHHLEELKNLSDNERWLLCSEGRPFEMEWLLMRSSPGE